MKLRDDPPVHLTYCLNVHPGETWEENLAAIREHALRVRDRVSAGRPFGLGLRLGARAAEALSEPAALAAFRELLDAERLYVFTINGFPYGPFHRRTVKQDVYAPDWRTPERLDYTKRLADVLAALLPEGVAGSISTVPGSYKPWIAGDEDVRRIAERFADAAVHLARLLEQTGRDICLALEPEPDCLLETTDETLAFFDGVLAGAGAQRLRDRHGFSADQAEGVLRRHVGVCLDTAHATVEFEDPSASLDTLVSAGVRVAKVQLSAALRATPGGDTPKRLAGFCDGVYLHQVKARMHDDEVRSYADLPEALDAAGGGPAELRVHVHVPLFFEGDGPMSATAGLLRGRFAEALRAGTVPHLEIETYTFGVLPASCRPDDVVDGIAGEYAWVQEHLLTGP